MATRTRNMIYPGVGIARLGPSTKEIFIGPDVPDPDFVPVPIKHPADTGTPGGTTYRDRDGKIRRQAARFRVYRVTERKVGKAWVPIKAREITADEATLAWTVTVANCKSFTAPPAPGTMAGRIQNTAPATTVSGRDQPVKRLEGTVENLLLAEIFTDAHGRLLVLAGHGESRPTGGAGAPSGLFSAKWFDDVCDGKVECMVDGKPAERAWIVTGVPAFAHQIGHPVTLYDVAETIAVATKKLPAPRSVSIVEDIYPMLRTTDLQSWMSDSAREHIEEHRSSEAEMKRVSDPSDDSERKFLFRMMRNPNTTYGTRRKSPFLPHWYPVVDGVVQNNFTSALQAVKDDAPPMLMPKQAGLTFTLTQWKRFKRWAEATKPGHLKWDYVDHATSIKKAAKLEDRSGKDQLDALNRAHLGSMVGGSTTPGIEVGWPALEAKSWGDAFRPSASLQPGGLTWTLSIPWPQDYEACTTHEVHGTRNDWWPAARPLSVFKGGTQVNWDRSASGGPDWWKDRGFFKNDGTDKYEEIDKP